METILNIITNAVIRDLSAEVAIIAGIFLLSIVAVLLAGQRRQKADKANKAEENPSDIETVIAELKSDPVRPSSPADIGQYTGPVLSTETQTQGSLEKEDCQTLEITRELDLSDDPSRLASEDEPSRLAPENAFSIEIIEQKTDIALSHIAPNFAAEPREIKPDTTGSPSEISTSTVQDKISIPRPGAEDISENMSESDMNCETDGKQGNSKIGPNVDLKLNVFAESSANKQINSEANYGDYEPNDSDLGVVTPHAIANAVAELVGSSIGPNPNPKPKEEVQDPKSLGSKDSPLKTEDKLDDKHNGFDEIEHLAEVEGKMRALRELFEAGLIAPEVYLLKAREYASEGL
jgi:hypothetical protein